MFDFTEDVIPETFGKQIPNPFPPQIEKIKGTDKSITFTVTRTDDLPADKDRTALIDRYKRQLQDSGRDLGVTVRTKVTGDPKDENATVKLTFWTVPMIVRKPKTNGDVMETPEGTEPEYDTEQSADEAAEAEAIEGIQAFNAEQAATDTESESTDETPAPEEPKRGRGGRFSRS